jgi:hypothetical protein
MADTTIKNAPRPFWTDMTYAAWLLRLATALLLLFSGLDKFKSADAPHTYSMDNWYGSAADAEAGKAPKYAKIAGVVFEYSGFNNAAVVGTKIANFNSHMFSLYGKALPFGFFIAGGMILLGFLSRIGHFIGGMTWLSLAVGQSILGHTPTMVALYFFMLLHVIALALEKHNRLSISGLINVESND